MITEDDFYTVAKTRPDVIRVFCNAANAVIDMRKDAAAPLSPWADVRLKEKQAVATQCMMQFADCFVVDGQTLSEDEKKLVQSWILRAANFHLRQREEQGEVGEEDAPGPAPALPNTEEAA
jgi:hypothetical protein